MEHYLNPGFTPAPPDLKAARAQRIEENRKTNCRLEPLVMIGPKTGEAYSTSRHDQRTTPLPTYLWTAPKLFTMSFTKGPSISLTYEQVEELVSQLDAQEKQRLAESLKKDGVKADWDEIFAATKPGQVPQREIDCVVKNVRAKRQARLRSEADTGRH